MLRAAAGAMFRPPQDELVPDRTDAFRGLALSGFHRVAYADWGQQDADVPVICVHGLTRQGRDFDYLARDLAARGRRVTCPDLVGRGRSSRLRSPDEYALPQYCADMNALIARLGAGAVDWVGTSLGGLIGIVLAGLPGSPIRRLVINDIGPYLPWAGLSRIGQYMADIPPGFADVEDAEAYFRHVLAPFGALSDEHWYHITRHSIAWDDSRHRYEMLCDPQIAHAFRSPWQYSLDLWKYWRAIDVPTLVLRGIASDLLPADLAVQMAERNPHMRLHEIEDVGHAPTLMTADQIKVVADFLNG